jgi:hypothetical protein
LKDQEPKEAPVLDNQVLITKDELSKFGKNGEDSRKPLDRKQKLPPINKKPGLPPIPRSGLSKDYAKKRAELKQKYKEYTENARKEVLEIKKLSVSIDETPEGNEKKSVLPDLSLIPIQNNLHVLPPIALHNLDESIPSLKMPKKAKDSFDQQQNKEFLDHDFDGSQD